MKTIPYTESAFHYAGRWRDSGNGMDSGWQGAQVRFKVSGSGFLRVSAHVLDNSSADVTFAAVNIDGGATIIGNYTTTAGSGSGLKSVDFTLPDRGEHKIVLKMACLPTSQWSGSSYCRLSSIGIDDTGIISAWVGHGATKIQVVGDSWMGAQSDWPRLLGLDDFDVYPVSFGGATIVQLNAQYLLDRAGVTNAGEPSPDIVLINSGVNDLHQGIPLSSFQWHLNQLIGKVKEKHPDAQVVLVGSPRNNLHSIDYQKYLPAMQAAATENPGVMVIPIPPPVWSTLQWAEQYHLTQSGLVTFASYVKSQLPRLISYNAGGATLKMIGAVESDALISPCLIAGGNLYRAQISESTLLEPRKVYCNIRGNIYHIASMVSDN